MLKHATALAAALALAAPAAAHAGFKEPVHVIWQHTGTPGGYFGWAVSGLADINHDGADDAIVGEPFPGARHDVGAVGRDGRRAALVPRPAGRRQRLRDRRRRRRQPRRLPRHPQRRAAPDARTRPATPTSTPAATARCCTRSPASATPDSFGSAVSSAGDVNRDGRPDLLIGAPQHAGGGIAYVFSGPRTYQLLYTIPAPDATHAFGAGTGTTDDVNRDRVPDEIVGGGGAGYVFSGATGQAAVSRCRRRPPRSSSARSSWPASATSTTTTSRTSTAATTARATTARRAASRPSTPAATARCCTPGPARSRARASGPGRGAGDVNGDHVNDIAVGSYTSSEGAPTAGKIDIFSGATGRPLRTITSTTEGENLGFDAVGVGDVNRDRRPDLLASAAEGDTVYMIAGIPRRHGHWW